MRRVATITVPPRRQGLPGLAHGGWTAWLAAREIDEPITVGFVAPIPLETELALVTVDDLSRSDGPGWHLVDPRSPESPILEIAPWQPDCVDTDPVSVGAAVAANRVGLASGAHPAPECLSCGVGAESLGVHSGPLGDGRFVAVFDPKGWAVGADGFVDPGAVWTAMDCSASWYITPDRDERPALTVQLAVDIAGPIRAVPHALVSWWGDYAPAWQGRKRGAAGALFDPDGVCVARSRSFWVAPVDPAQSGATC